MRLRHFLPLFLSALLLQGCASVPAAREAPPIVLLVSIDAFHPRYLDAGLAPNLARLAREGVRAEWMNPSYPSLTFPNHYTLVTGLRPDRHGIVHNTMRDESLGGFRLSDRHAVGNGAWWGGEPIWIGAQKAGLRSATMFWPGSEAEIDGMRPTHWKPFDYAVPFDTRVDQLVAWLDVPAARQPQLATLYFEKVDKAAHETGPDSAQTRAAIVETDAAIGRLLRRLAARGLLDRTNLIVVSDHGMATVAPGHAIAVEDMVPPADATVVSIGQSIGIAPQPGRKAQVEARLLGAHPQYDCWRKGELPVRWDYGSHPRIPPIVCQMHEGWDALPRAVLEQRPKEGTRGSHGFDPALPSMRALFIAHGPAFHSGVVLPPFDNVDVYPLLAQLLGIRPAANDGDPGRLLPALRPGVAATHAD
ncbi:putative AlkP superfamily pyrophosphatase or phosphodiesterase [Luteimonas cucumeris]|uniref:Putative AlkP superfamily pyrophosphatase or phosphodiesterase n=1 Tax=Luteimonas cucumeris TaxID=985012 RepID=A0A562L027_9GAMM|nr:ectonucleotide pyrophosphatase/phosphodiesterase [Luteimonas cucumeris]TWI00968.1 putative AlkP superfamily pyrophosphatase or phosphodiesterase [Luteimonas cucumeris]